MSATIPSRNWQMFWRAHFVLAIIVTLWATGHSAMEFARDLPAAELLLSVPGVVVVALALVLLIVPLVAEWGLLQQRALGARAFWRAFFVVSAALYVAGIVWTAFLGWNAEFIGVEPIDVLDVASWLIGIGQLFATAWYTYGSDHLWCRASIEVSA